MQPYKNGTSCADCPNRCENNLCNCDGVVCENDGILDLTTCTCHCSLNRPYYTGSQCSLNCSALTPDPSFCTSSVSIAQCAQYSNIPYTCPVLCKVCNYSLSSVAEITTTPSTSTSIMTTTVPLTSHIAQTTTHSLVNPDVMSIVSSGQKCEPRFTVIENHSACLNKSAEVGSSGVTEVEKKAIVDKHNFLRSRVNPPAKNMMKMSWDNDVALVAQKWAENCELKHDGNYQRWIPGRFSAGQNLLWARYKSTWNVTIYSWYAEVYEFTYGGPIPPGVGHYTQIVWADSIKVGCGYAHCQAKGVHYYVCNYSPGGNSYNMQPYKNGTSCADCPNRCENNLCNCGGVVCENDGILDLTTCTCHCSLNRPYYTGSQCSLNCSALTPDPSFCTSSVSIAQCAQYSNIPYTCPVLCKVCNYSLASVAKTTTTSSTSISNSIMTTTVPLTSSQVAPSTTSQIAQTTTKSIRNQDRLAPVAETTTKSSTSTSNSIMTTTVPLTSSQIAQTTTSQVAQTTTAQVAPSTTSQIAQTTTSQIVQTTTSQIAQTTTKSVTDQARQSSGAHRLFVYSGLSQFLLQIGVVILRLNM
ncbi:peptidase inhibitor 16-like [Ostrea edulis]|uniref:peptidase inhibitor 16-like n=1 Tax=Ostrea edulis TaxID=37623 RepID=UPI0024AFC0BB|nr:peptidase inhibitor 16-like [Ostrea edulis]